MGKWRMDEEEEEDGDEEQERWEEEERRSRVRGIVNTRNGNRRRQAREGEVRRRGK